MTPEEAKALRCRQIDELRSNRDFDADSARAAREAGQERAAEGFELAAKAADAAIADLLAMDDTALIAHYTYCAALHARIDRGY